MPLSIASVLSAHAADTDLIAYFHGDWGNLNIYTIPVGGGTPTQLTQNAGNNLDPEWSPDGTRLAFQSDRDGADAIYVMNADGSDPTRLSPAGVEGRHPSWSSDGTQILYTGARTVSIMNSDGTDSRTLIPASLGGWNAKWALGGSKIVFESDRDGDAEIFIMNADGSEITQLTNNDISDQHPILSPDGTLIAFNSSAPGRQDFDLYIMNADGTDVRRITTATDHDEYPSWSSDGQQLVYAYGNAAIYVINIDGTGERRLTPSRFWTAGPAWQPAETAPTDDDQAE
ncbi:hypothetical protein KJ567_03265 [Candidatus Bipolaricaulota bacterium]|nr:hypothetical protein [Candidatus Bipolaricaulota bacterium]